jgi:hypothetical protein
MVAVMAVLMVGGEHSTEDDSTQDPLRLRSLNPVSERCLSNGQDNFVLTPSSPLLTNTFAQTCLLDQTSPLQSRGGPYIVGQMASRSSLKTGRAQPVDLEGTYSESGMLCLFNLAAKAVGTSALYQHSHATNCRLAP